MATAEQNDLAYRLGYHGRTVVMEGRTVYLSGYELYAYATYSDLRVCVMCAYLVGHSPVCAEQWPPPNPYELQAWPEGFTFPLDLRVKRV